MPVNIKEFFDIDTSTFTYIVSDIRTSSAAIIDPVLNYDQYSSEVYTTSADQIISYIKQNNLKVEWILETHVHADHLTASHYIQENLGGKIGISACIKEILNFWVPIFNIAHDTPLTGEQFDYLFQDKEIIKLGDADIKIIYTPGHTPACCSYLIEDNIFIGDTIFMPDIGTARTDFPGGSAETLYDSIQRILSFSENTKIFMCHDYPPEGRNVAFVSTVKEQKEKNILINHKISKEEFVKIRNTRDENKPVPKMLLPSIQVNLRAGSFGKEESNGLKYIKIPLLKGMLHKQ